MKTKLGKPNCLRYQPALESPLRVCVQLAENELPHSLSLGTLLGTGAAALTVGMAEELGSCPAGFSEQHSFPVWGYRVVTQVTSRGRVRRSGSQERTAVNHTETDSVKVKHGLRSPARTEGLLCCLLQKALKEHALNQPLPSHEWAQISK